MTDQDAAVRLGPHKQPERQYQHASEVKTDVETISAGGQPDSRPAGGVVSGSRDVTVSDDESIRQLLAGPVAALTLVATAGMGLGIYGIVDILTRALYRNPGYHMYIPPIMLVCAIITLIDAVKMKRLEQYEWAIGGSILAIITAALLAVSTHFAFALAGSAGIWALIILNRADVKAAFRRRAVATETKKESDKRRFSRAAIVGACCMPHAILLLVLPLVLTDPKPLRSSEFFIMMRETTGGFVLTILLALVGLAAVFGTTILGFVSITHIRHSAGRLYGMGLAIFDALLFPLLLLNIAIFTVFRLAMGIPLAIAPQAFDILILIICGTLDFFLIRWAWRKTNDGLEQLQGDQIAGTP